MKNLKFKKAIAKNFLPFGPEGIKIDFESIDNIVLIKGENLDYKDANSKESSNGSGKSSIQEIIVWALYGKTVKNPKKLNVNDVIHNLYKKNCVVELFFDDYHIKRTRKPDSLKLFKLESDSWIDITQGKTPDTQAKIEEIIGLSYEAFLNTAVFTDDQSSCFLEADGPKKREIVENLLCLNIYKERYENSKILLKENKNSIKKMLDEYEMLCNNKSNFESKVQSTEKSENSWKESKKKELTNSLYLIKSKKIKLEEINEQKQIKEYEDAQNKIKSINSVVSTEEININNIINEKKNLEQKLDKNKQIESKTKESIRNLIFNKGVKSKEIEKIQNDIKSLKDKKDGQICDNCYSKIDYKNYESVIKNNESKIFDLNNEIEDLCLKIKNLEEKSLDKDIENLKEKINDLSEKEIDINKKLSELRKDFVKYSAIKEPQTNSQKKVLEAEIEMLVSKVKDLKKEYESNSPYSEILSSLKEDIKNIDSKIEDKSKSIKEEEKQTAYYEFWVNAFSETGIRKWVVDGIIPALNGRLEYWMQVLDDNRMKIVFDNELTEKIYKTLDEDVEFFYYTMSAGQKRRLNLAVNMSFAHIMMLTTNTCPSILFLDEVSTNIDAVGVMGIYNMVCELSKDRQIFITTHDPELFGMLSGCEVINLKMENGVSKLYDK